jgi:hypothetical protein
VLGLTFCTLMLCDVDEKMSEAFIAFANRFAFKHVSDA